MALDNNYNGLTTLKDWWGKVKANFTYLDNRISTIITTPAEGVTAQEIIDARKGETALGDKIDAIDSNINEIESNQASHEAENAYNFMNNTPLRIIAHRGFSALAPENTLIALQKAIEYGAKYVEFDVHATSDGEFVIIHDDTVDRTTDGTGAVASMTLAQIKALDAGTWFHAKYAGTPIPTLDEWLIMCNKYGIIPYCELKADFTEPQIQAIIEKLKKYMSGASGSFVVSSTSTARLQIVRAIDANIVLCFVDSATEQNIDSAKAIGNTMVLLNYPTITSDIMEYAKEQGVRVEAYTVDSYAARELVIELGVQGYTTNKLL